MRLFVVVISLLKIFSQYAQVPILRHQEKVNIVELKNLNSKYRECNLSVSPDGKSLYFMSTRPNNNLISQGDLYVSNYQNNSWSDPKALSSKINSYSGEDEPSLTRNDQYMYYQSWKDGWENRGGPYYRSEYKNEHWAEGIGIGGGIAQFFRLNYDAHQGFATDGMCVSSDEKLFIVACGSDYYGNMDLYYSQKINGVWSYPKLFGASTKGNERAVFIAADSKTIYFSSNGYGGYGGMDIFKTTFENGIIGEIVNIGEPFNTTQDDMGFVISGNGNSAFLIRDLNIYFADLFELDEEIKPTKINLESTAEETSYGIDNLRTITKDTIDNELKSLTRKEVKSKLDFRKDILFDFDSDKLDEKAHSILNLIVLEIKNDKCKISLKGHTDSFGSNDYNLNLSKRRVNAIEKWFEMNGIKIDSAEAFGEKAPKYPNNSKKNRHLNRRVELDVFYE